MLFGVDARARNACVTISASSYAPDTQQIFGERG
jgi:hypothetical protein